MAKAFTLDTILGIPEHDQQNPSNDEASLHLPEALPSLSGWELR